ncbi:hypothetical protein [Terrisporobacter sp.]|uniref:hypothetical protein n=1 Tax=Terrisporobacter sp. TaxID=1965305 RepID=UPI0026380E06|nr:hypothetical protein [Terrisporobacter sp.]
MNKRKVLIVLVFTILCSINLWGCSKGQNNKLDNKSEAKDAKIKSLKMLSNDAMQNGCSTEGGYYTISSSEDEEGNTVQNLMYVDYKTKKQIYLCDKSECNHNTDRCTSYIETKYFGRQNSLICDGKYLYLISSEYNDDGSISTSISYGGEGLTPISEPTSIYRMNLDGSNRILLSEFESGELLGEKILTDGEYIYCISMKNTQVKIDDNTSYTKGDEYKLIKISNESGEKQDITEWDSSWNILGCYKDKIIINKLEFDHELTVEEKMDQAKYTQACKNAKESIVSYDINTQKFEKLFENEMSDSYQYIMHEKNVFYYKYNGNKIMSFDLDTKQKSDFLETNNSNIEQIYDGYMITSDWKENNKEYYRIRIEDKEISKLSLYKDNGRLVNIIAESENDFFVESNCKNKDEYVEWAGINQTIETDREYAMIPKEDYFNNKNNFKKVNMIIDEIY